MSAVIIHLSDAHLRSNEDPLVARWPQLCRSIISELQVAKPEACIVVFCGDASFGGKAPEFVVAQRLLLDLRNAIEQAFPTLAVHLLTVPGNHDCDLTSEDATMRTAARDTVTDGVPAQSSEKYLLKVQENYFAFAKQLQSTALDSDHPYYKWHDIQCGSVVLRFHLLNTSWTSMKDERDDLRFPLIAFCPPHSSEAHCAITLMHHPVHWFKSPEVRRPLRDHIEKYSDLVLTAHEHMPEASARNVLSGVELNYVAGAVLQDHHDALQCSFYIMQLDVENKTQRTKLMAWDGGSFASSNNCIDAPLALNPQREDLVYRLRPEFETWLDDLEDPINHPRQPRLRLSHLFCPPDLRKTGEGVAGGAVRIKGDSLLREMSSNSRSLITGGDRSGKTSLCKFLFAAFRKANLIPVLIKRSDLSASGAEASVRRTVGKCIAAQYRAMTQSHFEQCDKSKRVIIVDDMQEGPADPVCRTRAISYLESVCGAIIVLASDDFALGLLNGARRDSAALIEYARFDICDFGNALFEDLATKWISLGVADLVPSDVHNRALDVCERVQGIVGVAGLPQSPWLLTVMLEQIEFPDTPLAAKSGDYGHLYHLLITIALSRSRIDDFQINGKFTYLAELAYYFYKKNVSVITDEDALAFHHAHCAKYDLDFEYHRVIDDLSSLRLLQRFGDEVSFRHKWVYCFFVAWWISKNLHRGSEAKGILTLLTQRLYHDVSANVLVFVAHLSEDPEIILAIRLAAQSFFRECTRLRMEDDINHVNELEGVDYYFELPATAPEINRKVLQDVQDEERARQEPSRSDGRLVKVHPDEGDDGDKAVRKAFDEIRGSFQMIRILGQVLQNGASSIESVEKVEIMDDVLGVGFRLLGHIFDMRDDLNEMCVFATRRIFRALGSEYIESCTKDGSQVSCSSLRGVWRDARLYGNRFWFWLYWMCISGVTKRLAISLGGKILHSTMEKIRASADSIPTHLVDLSIRLRKRGRTIPVQEMIRLHSQFKKAGNQLGKAVLEVMTFERLLTHDTDPSNTQSICGQMGIRRPIQRFDPNVKQVGLP